MEEKKNKFVTAAAVAVDFRRNIIDAFELLFF